MTIQIDSAIIGTSISIECIVGEWTNWFYSLSRGVVPFTKSDSATLTARWLVCNALKCIVFMNHWRWHWDVSFPNLSDLNYGIISIEHSFQWEKNTYQNNIICLSVGSINFRIPTPCVCYFNYLRCTNESLQSMHIVLPCSVHKISTSFANGHPK